MPAPIRPAAGNGALPNSGSNTPVSTHSAKICFDCCSLQLRVETPSERPGGDGLLQNWHKTGTRRAQNNTLVTYGSGIMKNWKI